MRNLNFIILVISIIVITACTSEEKTDNSMTYTNDIDQMVGWIDSPNIIKGNAHSGNYMSMVDSINIYGVTFSLPFSDLPDKSITKLKASVWGKWILGDALLVASLEADGKNLIWVGQRFKDVVPNPDEWGQISVSFEIPKDLPQQTKIKVYMASIDKGTAYCDDFEISFE